MDKVNVETPCNKDSETLSLKPSQCDCDDEDEKSSDGQPENETTTTAIKASGSYPYVIEMVYDSSSENLVTEKAAKSEKKQVMTPKDSDEEINKP
ncbi:GH19182 [Drosophila grimshawi]|uniref:GH19182 n=1 Tax=Drosophila grimshawi TaxID=7222 RepID=B4JEU1_DROGR|nr:GH19182 [Drosophila grimshawi]